jgi:hypothetical protein
MADVAIIDMNEIHVTPVFRMMEIENIPKSEEAGHLVKEMHEVVQIRFAGSNNYSPIFPAKAFYKREGNNVITYAERFADQYRQFKEGNPQEAKGTPLEMLTPYGITPEMLSLCRTMKVYSIEALDGLEGPNLKNLGMEANKLKDMARRWMAGQSSNKNLMDEVAQLKAKLAELEGKQPSVVVPVVTQDEVANVELDSKTDDEIRAFLLEKTGVKPDGRLGRTALLNMAKGL